MSYTRVIPRDLFNEASLLKCMGKLWIETERFPGNVTFEHDYEPFEIYQNQDDGSLSVTNINVLINGERRGFIRPLNSREPWPLYIETDEDRVAVFDDNGNLTEEFLAIVKGESVKEDTELTWENQLKAARNKPSSDLLRHALVSARNRHRCEDCYCCAAWTVIEERNPKSNVDERYLEAMDGN